MAAIAGALPVHHRESVTRKHAGSKPIKKRNAYNFKVELGYIQPMHTCSVLYVISIDRVLYLLHLFQSQPCPPPASSQLASYVLHLLQCLAFACPNQTNPISHGIYANYRRFDARTIGGGSPRPGSVRPAGWISSVLSCAARAGSSSPEPD